MTNPTFQSASLNFVDVGHSQLAYRKVGSGPDVVFIHGWPLHSATFRALVPLLSPHFTCHLFDMPCTGDTRSDASAPVSLEAHAATMRRALREVGLERYALVAHDSGGGIARLVAATEKERVVGLVMGNTEIPHFKSALLAALVGATKIPGARSVMKRMLRSRMALRSPAGFATCFDNPDFIFGDFHTLFIQPLIDEPERLAGQMKFIDGLDFDTIDNFENTHAAITAPVRLLWGVDDAWFPLRQARELLPQFGGAELHEMRGKLFTHEEFPEDFAAHTLPFLRDCFIGRDRDDIHAA